MKVKDIMTPQVECVHADATLVDVSRRMRVRGVGALPVVADGEAIGIVTDRDVVVRGLAGDGDPAFTTASEIMSKSLRACSQDDDVERAVALMHDHAVRRLLVRDSEGKLCGIVSVGDVARPANGKQAGDLLASLADRAGPKR